MVHRDQYNEEKNILYVFNPLSYNRTEIIRVDPP